MKRNNNSPDTYKQNRRTNCKKLKILLSRPETEENLDSYEDYYM